MPSSYSKSFFSNQGSHIGAKPLINFAQNNNNSFSVKSNFSQDIINSLKKIEQQYTSNLANGSYTKIPGDYVEFSKLYSQIANIQLGVLDSSISILLKITQEGLKGAMNALGLSSRVVESNVKNIVLQNQVNQLEAGFNQLDIYSNTNGQIQITQTFMLAPLYSYYVLLYGVPCPGEGFDPLLISQLASVLEENNIPLYN
jgi:hypothetical protein